MIPVNHPRLRIYPRRPYSRDVTAEGDYPLSAIYDETDALVVFDDVDVPAEHVFVDRDPEITFAQFNRTPAHLLGNTQAQIRYAVKMRFLAGLASQLAEWSGQSADRNFQLSMARVAAQASVPYGMVLAGEYNAAIDANGVARPDPEMLYAAMTQQPALYRDITFALRELTGGTTIQVPSSMSAWEDPVTRADFERFVRWPDVDAQHRVALLKLVWDAIGSEFASRHFQYEMFYAGSASVVRPSVPQLRLGSGPLHGAALPGRGPPERHHRLGAQSVTPPDRGRGADRIGTLDTGFRTALGRLDRAGLLARVSRTVDADLEVAGLMKCHDAGAALLFESVKDHDVPVVGNVFATPESSETAMGLDRARLRAALARGIHTDIEPVAAAEAPAQEQVWRKGSINLGEQLPVLKHAPATAGAS